MIRQALTAKSLKENPEFVKDIILKAKIRLAIYTFMDEQNSLKDKETQPETTEP